MVIYVPRSKVTDALLRDSFEQELSAGGGLVWTAAPLAIETQSLNEEARSVDGVASVESISRTGHLFRIAGMDIRAYNERNPVVLACHRQMSDGLLPGAIATVRHAYKRGDTLGFKGMTFDSDPIADAWWQKVRKGIVRMVSIGALPIEWDIAETTTGKKTVRFIEITESELGEISVTPLGANRGAYFDNARRGSQAVDARLSDLEAKVEQLLATNAKRESALQHDKAVGSGVNHALAALNRLQTTVS